jgi:dual specificity phosphatase 12
MGFVHRHRGMGWVDRIPRAGNLNIGGLGALFQPDHILQKAGITHVLSVLDYDLDGTENLRGMEHLQIRSEDVPNENLIQHFGRTNAFIDAGLSGKKDGGVYVHCAMGKSRSATMVCAYLMWKYGRSAGEALAQICEGRPICEPNVGFLEQLEVYEQILKNGDDEREARRIVEEWERTRFRGHVWEWEEWNAARVKGKL